MRGRVLDRLPRIEAAALLIGAEHARDLFEIVEAGRLQRLQRVHSDGEAALHVGDAGAERAIAVDREREALAWNERRVEIAEDQRTPVAVAAPPRDPLEAKLRAVEAGQHEFLEPLALRRERRAAHAFGREAVTVKRLTQLVANRVRTADLCRVALDVDEVTDEVKHRIALSLEIVAQRLRCIRRGLCGHFNGGHFNSDG